MRKRCEKKTWRPVCHTDCALQRGLERGKANPSQPGSPFDIPTAACRCLVHLTARRRALVALQNRTMDWLWLSVVTHALNHMPRAPGAPGSPSSSTSEAHPRRANSLNVPAKKIFLAIRGLGPPPHFPCST
uniref:Uncharacterized protein n=1 Tax=Eutreptiella gymnastica TaxID=73025 RepID=A0A7S4G0B6_9EUGL